MRRIQKRIISSALLCGLLVTGIPNGQIPISAASVNCNNVLDMDNGKIVIGAYNGSYGGISDVHLSFTSTFLLQTLSDNHVKPNCKFESSNKSVLIVTKEGLVIPCSDGEAVITATSESGATDDCDFNIYDTDTLQFKFIDQSHTSSISGFVEGREVADLYVPAALQGYVLKTITEDAFANVKTLESVTLQPELEKIEAGAFANCENLKTIIIQNPDAVIEDTAFGDLENEKDTPYAITIKGYEGSTAQAFAQKYENIDFVLIDKEEDNLTASAEKVFLSANKKLIGESVYLGVNTSQKIYADTYVLKEENEKITFSSSDETVAQVNEDGVLVGKQTGTAIITATTPNGVSKSFEVNIVEEIEDGGNNYKFNADGKLVLSQSNVTDINLSVGYTDKFINVDAIGQEALADNSNIANVVLANGVNKIESRAFANCENLKRLTIPETVTYIDDTAFGDYKNGDTPYKLTIYGECGSVAEKLADKYENITFIRNNPLLHNDCKRVEEDNTSMPTQVPEDKGNQEKEKSQSKPDIVQNGVKTSVKKKNTKKVIKTKVKFTRKKAKLKVGSKYRFRVSVTGTKKTVKWSVSNKKIATINKKTGKLTAKKAGKVIVKATCNNVTKKYKITIRK